MESDKIEQQRNKVTKPGFSGPEAVRGICHLNLCSFVTSLFNILASHSGFKLPGTDVQAKNFTET
jgi:hypothetical protein